MTVWSGARRGIVAALATVGLASCGGGGQTVTVREVMADKVNPATLAIWEIGNKAMNDEGGLDPAKLDSAKWKELAAHAATLGKAGRAMQAAAAFRAAAPGKDQVAEGEVSMAAVQKLIDANPDGFRQAAGELAAFAEDLDAAAKAKDWRTAGDRISGIDQVCEACHQAFWYPEG